MAALELSDPNHLPILKSVIQHATPRLPSFASQELSNVCWGLATLGVHDATFMDAVADVSGLE